VSRLAQRGFSLLEAIIALTIMASTLLVLYGWLSSSALALGRVQDNALRLQDMRSALAVVDTLNPMDEPAGETRSGDLLISWTSTPLTDVRLAITRSNLPSAFDVRLFDMDVRAERANGQVRQFQVRRAGWLLSRPPPVDE